MTSNDIVWVNDIHKDYVNLWKSNGKYCITSNVCTKITPVVTFQTLPLLS